MQSIEPTTDVRPAASGVKTLLSRRVWAQQLAVPVSAPCVSIAFDHAERSKAVDLRAELIQRGNFHGCEIIEPF